MLCRCADSLGFFYEAVCCDGFLGYEADAAESDGADDPFGIDDVRQYADSRYEHPGDEDDDGSQNRVERSLSGAIFRCIHGHEDDDCESRHKRQAGHEGRNDAADGQGEAQGQQAQEQDRNTGNGHVFLIGHIGVDELFMNIMGIERSRRQQEIASRADIGSPQRSQRHAGNPGIEGHDEFRQSRRRRNSRIHFGSDDAEECCDEANGQHDQAANDEAFAGRLDILGTQGNLDDSLKRNIDRNEDDDPRDNSHGADTADEVHGRNGRSLDSDDVDTAGHAQDKESSDGNTDVLQGNIEDVRLAGRPHTTDEGNTDEDDGTGEHPRNRREDVRHQSGQDSAAGNVLQTHDDQLDQNLTANTGNHAAAVIIPFQQFRHRRNVELTILLGDRQAHDDGPDAPGSRIPTGRQPDFVGLFGNADSRSPADSQADDRHHDEGRRQFTASQYVSFRRSGSLMLDIPADTEENADVH